MQAFFFLRMKMTWTFFLSNCRWDVLLHGCLLKFQNAPFCCSIDFFNETASPTPQCRVWQSSHPTVIMTCLEWTHLILEFDTFSHFPISYIAPPLFFKWEPGIPTSVLPETNFGTSKLLTIRTPSRDASKALLCWRNSNKELWEPCGLLAFYSPFHSDLLRQWSLTPSLAPPRSLLRSSVGASRLLGSSVPPPLSLSKQCLCEIITTGILHFSSFL